MELPPIITRLDTRVYQREEQLIVKGINEQVYAEKLQLMGQLQDQTVVRKLGAKRRVVTCLLYPTGPAKVERVASKGKPRI